MAFARCPCEHSAIRALRQGDLEDAEKIERENEHDHAHPEDKIGIGELHRPTHLAPGALQDDEERGQPDEPNKDARHEGEAAHEDVARGSVPRVG